MKKIGYFLFNESLDSGLIKSQVIDFLKNINNDYEIYLINFVPFYKALDIYKVKKMNKQLSEYNVKILFLPITIPSRLFVFKRWFKFFSYIYTPFLLILCYFFKFNILHCRSYFSTSIGVNCKKIIPELKIIFDTRSLFIEENVSAGNIPYKDKSYYKWKQEEKRLLVESDKVIAINESFKKYYTKYIPRRKLKIIPILVDEEVVFFDEEKRKKLRDKFNIKNKTVISYVGSFYGWNDPELYADYFKKLSKVIETPFFLIITRDKKEIKKSLKKRGVESQNYYITSCKHKRIRDFLSAADYGIIVMNENLDSNTRLGVKFIEYLATGLTVVTNSNVGAAKNFILNNKCGIILEKEDELKEINKIKRSKVLKKYKDNFSKNIILRKYERVYKNV